MASQEETVVVFEPHQLIACQITRRDPPKNHIGIIDFAGDGDATAIDHVIRLDGKLPGIGPLVAKGLGVAWRKHAPRALARLQA